jgi:hypothetical protein
MMSTRLRLLSLGSGRHLIVICAAGIIAMRLAAPETAEPVNRATKGATLPGTAVLRSAAEPDGTIATADAIAAVADLGIDGYAGTLDADGTFTFEGLLCFDFPINLGFWDSPPVAGVAEPADGCRTTTVTTRGGSSDLLSVAPGDPGTVQELDFSWTDRVPASGSATKDLSYTLGFRGDADVDGRVESSKVMAWCEWAAGSAQEHSGLPPVDGRGCLAWIVAPCGGSVVRGPGTGTAFPVQCAAEHTAWAESPNDAEALVEAPVGQVEAHVNGLNGPPKTAPIARYRMPHQITITRRPDSPVVASFDPNSGPAGTLVTIAGSGFTGATAVWFNTAAAETFVVDSEAQVRALVPAGADSGPISVAALGGTGVSAVSFTVSAPALPPVVTGFTPTGGPPGTEVTVSGTSFTETISVTFGGTAGSFAVDSDTQIRATVPATASTGPIAVTTTSGSFESADSFEVTPAEPPSPSQGIWISRDEIMNLPMSGPAWDALVANAQRDPGLPNLSDQDQQNNVLVLARALVCIRTSDEALCETARQAVMSAIETENGGRTLALGRELLAYVIAADLVGLESEQDGVFRSWLAGVLTEELDGWTLISTHEDRPNNWGTHAGASRAAAAIYLGDTEQLQRVASVFKGYLGDRTSYAGFRYGERSWQADPALPVGINPAGSLIEGHDVDGVLPDDQRRAGTFSWPPPKSIYAWEGLQGAVAQAVVLHRAGYDVWNWGDQALRRAVVWLHAQGDYPAEGDDTWLPHLINHYYGTQVPAAVPSRPGKNVGYTDWTHAGAE